MKLSIYKGTGEPVVIDLKQDDVEYTTTGKAYFGEYEGIHYEVYEPITD